MSGCEVVIKYKVTDLKGVYFWCFLKTQIKYANLVPNVHHAMMKTNECQQFYLSNNASWIHESLDNAQNHVNPQYIQSMGNWMNTRVLCFCVFCGHSSLMISCDSFTHILQGCSLAQDKSYGGKHIEDRWRINAPIKLVIIDSGNGL